MSATCRQLRLQIEQKQQDFQQILVAQHHFKRIESFVSYFSDCFRNETANLYQCEVSNNEREYVLDYAKALPNSQNAFKYAMNLPKSAQITSNTLYEIHRRLARHTDVPGGIYRQFDAFSMKLGIHAPTYEIMIQKMNDVLYEVSRENIDVLTRAMDAHYEIIALQPFGDYNKRLARIVADYILVKNGHPPFRFDRTPDNIKYYNALRARVGRDDKAYEKYMLGNLNYAWDKLIAMATKSSYNQY